MGMQLNYVNQQNGFKNFFRIQFLFQVSQLLSMQANETKIIYQERYEYSCIPTHSCGYIAVVAQMVEFTKRWKCQCKHPSLKKKNVNLFIKKMFTGSPIYIYTSIYMCVCVCVYMYVCMYTTIQTGHVLKTYYACFVESKHTHQQKDNPRREGNVSINIKICSQAPLYVAIHTSHVSNTDHALSI